MQIYELSDKDFKIIVLKEINNLQENTYRQLNKIRKMHVQNENINRDRKYNAEPNKNLEAEEYSN